MLFGLSRKKKKAAAAAKPKVKIDVDVIKDDQVNQALESMNAPFYRVCTKAKKGYSWRRLSTSCNPDYLNAYAASENDVSQWLGNVYNVKLKDFIDDPLKYKRKFDRKPKIDSDEKPAEIKESITDLFDRIENRIKEARI